MYRCIDARQPKPRLEHLCLGGGGTGVGRQPVIGNVAQFVVRYGFRVGTNNIQYRDFGPNLPWVDLAAVRVCMVLTSQGPVEDFHALYRDTPGLTFADCGPGTITRTTVVGDTQRRLYRTYQQVFTLRPSNA